MKKLYMFALALLSCNANAFPINHDSVKDTGIQLNWYYDSNYQHPVHDTELLIRKTTTLYLRAFLESSPINSLDVSVFARKSADPSISGINIITENGNQDCVFNKNNLKACKVDLSPTANLTKITQGQIGLRSSANSINYRALKYTAFPPAPPKINSFNLEIILDSSESINSSSFNEAKTTIEGLAQYLHNLSLQNPNTEINLQVITIAG